MTSQSVTNSIQQQLIQFDSMTSSNEAMIQQQKMK